MDSLALAKAFISAGGVTPSVFKLGVQSVTTGRRLSQFFLGVEELWPLHAEGGWHILRKKRLPELLRGLVADAGVVRRNALEALGLRKGEQMLRRRVVDVAAVNFCAVAHGHGHFISDDAKKIIFN